MKLFTALAALTLIAAPVLRSSPFVEIVRSASGDSAPNILSSFHHPESLVSLPANEGKNTFSYRNRPVFLFDTGIFLVLSYTVLYSVYQRITCISRYISVFGYLHRGVLYI